MEITEKTKVEGGKIKGRGKRQTARRGRRVGHRGMSRIKAHHMDIWKCHFFIAVLGFELRAYTLSHSTGSFFVVGFFDTGLASKRNPSDLCLLSS
jgi:hypothetical protein